MLDSVSQVEGNRRPLAVLDIGSKRTGCEGKAFACLGAKSIAQSGFGREQDNSFRSKLGNPLRALEALLDEAQRPFPILHGSLSVSDRTAELKPEGSGVNLLPKGAA